MSAKTKKESQQMEEKNGLKSAAAEAADVYPLDDAAIEFIAQTSREMEKLQAGISGMLTYFARQHKLAGNWTLAENRRELVLVPASK